MTLIQYLNIVAWLFIAFLMWFSVTRAQYVYDSDDAKIYLIINSVNKDYKARSGSFFIVLFVFGPALFYTFLSAVFIGTILIS